MIKIENFWHSLEHNKKHPKNLKKINIINSDLFLKKIKSKNMVFIKKMISNLYSGECYIIKNAISKKYFDKLKLQLTNYSKESNSSFHKMYEKCPNYWRRQGEKEAKKYSFIAVRDSYYFFRWNKENFKIWKNFDNLWSCVKFLGGLKYDEYTKNTPKDGIVDRVQIVRYPENTGRTVPHIHNPTNQRIIISLYMSKLYSDFSKGGMYFLNKNKKINCEKYINVGDLGIFYATLPHGVDSVEINKNIKAKNESVSGRWWCGLYSPESDHKPHRKTSSAV